MMMSMVFTLLITMKQDMCVCVQILLKLYRAGPGVPCRAVPCFSPQHRHTRTLCPQPRTLDLGTHDPGTHDPSAMTPVLMPLCISQMIGGWVGWWFTDLVAARMHARVCARVCVCAPAWRAGAAPQQRPPLWRNLPGTRRHRAGRGKPCVLPALWRRIAL